MSRKNQILIAPLVGEYGGVAQHILNIIKFSSFNLTALKPKPLCLYYGENRIKRYIRYFCKRTHINYVDIYGLMINKVYFSHFDIIHLHGHPYWPEIYLKFNKNAKYIHTVHQVYFEEDCYSDDEWNMKQRLNNLMFDACKKSDIVISVAKWQQKILLESGISSIFIPNGIDVEVCDSANSREFREKYQIYDDFYVFPGDIRHSKRPEIFIALAEMITDKKFIMIGKGMTKENLSRILRIDIPNNVICLGPIPQRDVLNLFSASKVFILPSKNETFSISMIEAMGCKKVIVAANNAGPKEIITDGIDGFLFEPDNIESLYEKAVLAWNYPEIGNNAYNLAKNKFNWRILIKEIDLLYSQLSG